MRKKATNGRVGDAGGGIDLVLSCDTTGSMFCVAAEVQNHQDELAAELGQRIPGLRLGAIAHGDYCDEHRSYLIKSADLTDDIGAVRSFIRTVGRTDGGDAPECYELVLNRARSFAWCADKRRALVLFGDEVPHEPNYPGNTRRLDWRNEARMLKELGVRVYTVQCRNVLHATPFYRELAEITGGLHLRLNQFSQVPLLLLGIAYQQQSEGAFQDFETRVRNQGPVSYDLGDIFDTLAGRAKRTRRERTDGLIPVDPARFQLFKVRGEPQIRDFVESRGFRFLKGHGFYPLTVRPEMIQENKEVVLEDLNTGEFFTGAQARDMIGLPYGQRGRVSANPLPGFRVWVQSTSVNRKLRDEDFLYEDPDKAEGKAPSKPSRRKRAVSV